MKNKKKKLKDRKLAATKNKGKGKKICGVDTIYKVAPLYYMKYTVLSK